MKKKIFYFYGLVFVLTVVSSALVFYFKNREFVVEVNLGEQEREETIEQKNEAYKKISEDPSDLNSYLSAALAEKTLGNLSATERLYKKGIEQNPDFYLFYLNLGSIYEDMEKYDKAELAYRAGIEKKPVEEQGYLKLTRLIKWKFPQRASELDDIFQQGIAATQNINILKEYAQYLEDQGRYRDAWVHWKEIASMSKDPELAQQEVKRLAEILGISE